MSRLDDFLALPNVADETAEIFINARLGKFIVKPMTVTQHKSYQDQCRGKMNKDGVKFDGLKFNLLVVANHIIEPNLNDAEFLHRSGYPLARDFISAKFKPGEVVDIANKIIELSGFDLDGDINEEIEEAKN